MHIFINYKQGISPDHALAIKLEQYLKNQNHLVFRDETKLKGGDVWPKVIYDNLRTCDVVISLISNASMQSPWVINEIDEARKLNKALIPVLLETLDSTINFTKYRPRFLDIQYVAYKASMEEMFEEICVSLKNLDVRVPFYGIINYAEIIKKYMALYGIDSPVELLAYYFEHLQDYHILFAAIAERDGKTIKNMMGKQCRTAVEGNILDIQDTAEMHKHNYTIHSRTPPKNERERISAEWYKRRAEVFGCLADICKQLLNDWQPFVEQRKQSLIKKR